VLENAEADHCLVVRSKDPGVVKKGHVTAHHLLLDMAPGGAAEAVVELAAGGPTMEG